MSSAYGGFIYMRRMHSEKQIKEMAKEMASKTTDYTGSVQYLNGYSNDGAFIRIYEQNAELKIILSGQFAIDQEEFTPGIIQVPVSFELDEAISRKLYVGDSNTAAGNVCKIAAIYYNDITYITSACVGFLTRLSEGGNVYVIKFGNNELTSESQLTSFEFRVSLAL